MGDNIYLGDRNGVRTPMQWNGGTNAGFSSADPERLYSSLVANTVYGYQAVNVESQRRFDHSLLCWTKSLIRARNSLRVFSRGSIEFLCPSNHRILAYVRELGEEKVLVVNNLSGSAQVVELDMHRYKDYTPIEMSSENRFPRFGRRPYLLTLGSYQFYWFRLCL